MSALCVCLRELISIKLCLVVVVGWLQNIVPGEEDSTTAKKVLRKTPLSWVKQNSSELWWNGNTRRIRRMRRRKRKLEAQCKQSTRESESVCRADWIEWEKGVHYALLKLSNWLTEWVTALHCQFNHEQVEHERRKIKRRNESKRINDGCDNKTATLDNVVNEWNKPRLTKTRAKKEKESWKLGRNWRQEKEEAEKEYNAACKSLIHSLTHSFIHSFIANVYCQSAGSFLCRRLQRESEIESFRCV